MNDYSIIKARIEAFQENLNSAIRTMDSPKIDADLRESVRTHFLLKINDKQRELGLLLKDLDSGVPLNLLWNNVITKRKECSDLLHREYLPFLEGALVREAGFDNGICAIADALLAEIAKEATVPWQRFTIPAEADFFTEMTEIIRIRFPVSSIWNLPIVCHELGHFVATEVNKKKKAGVMETFVQSMDEKEKNRQMRLQGEYFADLFATYAMGPAYACTCILLNFDPCMIDDSEEHPADVKRAYFVLSALEEMKKTEKHYEVIIKPLREVWQRNLAAVNLKKLDMNTKQELNALLDAFLTRVFNKYLNTVRYKSWSLAYNMAFNMKNKTTGSLSKKDTLRDVLNAAWIGRILNIKDSSQIGKKALEFSLALRARALTRRQNS